MADFSETLNTLLSDPDAMGKILSLAGQLGGGTPKEETTPPAAPPPAQEPPSQDLAQMVRLMGLFQQQAPEKQETHALLEALRPFLRPERQKKLDRAMQFVRLSQTAQEAIRLWKEGELHV